MLNVEQLVAKYGDDCKNKIVDIQELLNLNFDSEDKLYKISEDIVDVLVQLKLDIESVCTGYVYSFVLEKHELLENFSKHSEIYGLLNSLLTVESYSKNYTDPNGLKEMLIAITKDIRVVIIKTAHVLVEARNKVKRQTASANELFKLIDDIYAPFAARLGLSEIKSELQDLSFEYHHPSEYAKLKFEVAHETRANMHMINKVVSEIKSLLEKNNINCVCYGRVKHLSSIYKKIKEKTHSLKNIYDVSAARIIVNSVSECYTALGIVHSYFAPVDGRFKDYIANPKQNGYQSLHTTVYYRDEFFEIQIRTHDMHEFAEYGVAAHFLYKENKTAFNGLDGKLLWIRKLLENKDEVSSERILDELKTDVYLGEIFVQTPKGKVIKLLENSTPIDFAYAIHSDVGNKCVGARVNGNMVPLFSTLSNGDTVEIITSQNSKGPSRDWLKKVKMPSTKDKINSFFKKQMKEENIKLGKSMIEQYAKANDISLSSILKDEYINVITKRGSFGSFDEICAGIGYGSITAEKVVRRLESLKLAADRKTRTFIDDIAKNSVKTDNKSDIAGVQGALTKYCKCCNPIPGDDIVGYVSRGRGVIIHKKSCDNLARLSADRFIEVDWNTTTVKDYTFTSIINLVAKPNSNIYLEITNAMSELAVKVVSLNTNQNKFGELLLKVGVLVKDRNQLQQVKNKLGSLASVYEVEQ